MGILICSPNVHRGACDACFCPRFPHYLRMKPYWSGVFPAITTQMHKDGSLDIEATARHAEALIESGVSGLIFLGSLGENQPMNAAEKRLVLETMAKAVNGRISVLSGVAETSTA